MLKVHPSTELEVKPFLFLGYQVSQRRGTGRHAIITTYIHAFCMRRSAGDHDLVTKQKQGDISRQLSRDPVDFNCIQVSDQGTILLDKVTLDDTSNTLVHCYTKIQAFTLTGAFRMDRYRSCDLVASMVGTSSRTEAMVLI